MFVSVVGAFDWMGRQVELFMPPGDFRDLLIHGAINGVGAVVTFLPQILLLFLFLGILEDTGYMSRAAFIMDRLMNKVGLHGKAFIPILSSFAFNIGVTVLPNVEGTTDAGTTVRQTLSSYFAGTSVIWLLSENFNLMCKLSLQ
jgi:ferrous iron transport protein B